jgi:hypothetical protein
MKNVEVKVESLRLESAAYDGLDGKMHPAQYAVNVAYQGDKYRKGAISFSAQSIAVLSKDEIIELFELTEEEFAAIEVYPMLPYAE